MFARERMLYIYYIYIYISCLSHDDVSSSVRHCLVDILLSRKKVRSSFDRKMLSRCCQTTGEREGGGGNIDNAFLPPVPSDFRFLLSVPSQLRLLGKKMKTFATSAAKNEMRKWRIRSCEFYPAFQRSRSKLCYEIFPFFFFSGL